jgi:hypothetical protein
MELIMAFVMGAFSVYQAIKSAELPIGWIPDEGPGGGAFPFWLSDNLLHCDNRALVQGNESVVPVHR